MGWGGGKIIQDKIRGAPLYILFEYLCDSYFILIFFIDLYSHSPSYSRLLNPTPPVDMYWRYFNSEARVFISVPFLHPLWEGFRWGGKCNLVKGWDGKFFCERFFCAFQFFENKLYDYRLITL